MKICAVTVTYGNRAGFCIRISENVLTQGVDLLIIVDNGSIDESRESLIQFAREHQTVRLISAGSNTGSAKGFGLGIEAFLASGCDILLLLDDDNLLSPGAISFLTRFWNGISIEGKASQIALAAFREDRPNMVAALQTGNPNKVLPIKNSFMGFHFRLIWQFFRQRISSLNKKPLSLHTTLEIPSTTYGGLWMHRNLCEQIGLPDYSYVLYMDDFAYTKKISNVQGKIILLRDCTIHDIQQSYYLPAKKKWLYHSILSVKNDSITYYTCRNIVFFCKKNLVTNSLVYQMNRLFYFLAVSLLAILNGKTGKLKIIFRAVRDAESSEMGLNQGYPL